MPLELRKDSKWWYGRFKVNNRRFCVKLGVKVVGTVPKSLKEEGDAAFERSKKKARAKLEQFVAEARSRGTAESHLEKLYEIKSGETVGSITLAEMAAKWDKIPVKRPPSSRYVDLGHSIIKTFVEFIAKKYPTAATMADVKPKLAISFLRSEEAKGISGRTWNSKLILLRSVFRGLAREAGIASNPFACIPTKEEDAVHRQSYDEPELKRILENTDEFSRPIVLNHHYLSAIQD